MDEHLNQLLCDVIRSAIAAHLDPTNAAEKAAKAYRAGLAAYRAVVTEAVQSTAHQAAQ